MRCTIYWLNNKALENHVDKKMVFISTSENGHAPLSLYLGTIWYVGNLPSFLRIKCGSKDQMQIFFLFLKMATGTECDTKALIL